MLIINKIRIKMKYLNIMKKYFIKNRKMILNKIYIHQQQ